MKKASLVLSLLPLFGPAMAAAGTPQTGPGAKPPVLTGTVTDPDGRPLAGVILWVLTRVPSPTSYIPPAAPPTGPAGTFAIPGLPEGRIQLHGSRYVEESLTVCQRGEPVHLRMRPLDGPPREPDGQLVAGAGLFAAVEPGCDEDGNPCPPDAKNESCRRMISGRIVDAAGAPLEQAHATARVTDVFEEGSRTWSVLAPDETCDCLPVPLRGRVIGPDGEPVPCTQLSLISLPEGKESCGAVSWNGRFLALVEPGLYHLSARASGFSAELATAVRAESTPVEEIEIQLERHP